MRLTGEQQDILDVARTGASLSIEAYAGTGKTTTLQALAQDRPDVRMFYGAFNKAIVKDAQGKFPPSVTCKTQHGLAFATVGSKFSHRLNLDRPSPRDLAAFLEAEPVTVQAPTGVKRFSPGWFASTALRSVNLFCQGGDPILRGQHIAWAPNMKPEHDGPDPWFQIRQELGPILLDYARRIWHDVTSPDGSLRVEHDHYFKLFQLRDPVLPFDVILFDEAQDASGVMLALVEAQRKHAQVIYVGDRHQAIYSWRGAVNAMENVVVDETRYLTGSFRFGETIAAAANEILVGLFGCSAPLRGLGPDSQLAPLERPDVTLCRTNSGIVSQVITDLVEGRDPGVVGGTRDIVWFAESAAALQEGRAATHPELAWAADWTEVLNFVDEDPNGQDLKSVVRIIEKYGARVVADRLRRCSDEDHCSVLYSTAHKGKGREWDTVRLHDDFADPDYGTAASPYRVENVEEMRLLYVALTRAKEILDNGSCGWMINAPQAHETPELAGRWKEAQ